MRPKLLLITLLFPSLALALSCPKEKSLEEIAKELINIENSGIRINGQENSPCLDQKRYDHYAITFDASNESFQGATHLISDNSSLKIASIALTDPEVFLYTAKYTITAKSVSSEAEEELSDSLSFFIYKDPKNIKKYGCAGVTTPPNYRILLKNCKVTTP